MRHSGDLSAQTEAAVDSVESVLEELGADIEDVVKIVIAVPAESQ